MDLEQELQWKIDRLIFFCRELSMSLGCLEMELKVRRERKNLNSSGEVQLGGLAIDLLCAEITLLEKIVKEERT